jgi:hypothetical protein
MSGIIFFGLFLLAAAFALASFRGAPYLPVRRRDTAPLLELAELASGHTLIDLGSGDGQLLRAAAAQGIRGIGYEINPVLVLISRLVCWRYRHLVTIHLGDFWQTKLPPADVVYVFLLPRYMQRLDQKLEHELTRPTTLVSYIFDIPGRKPIRTGANALVYRYHGRSPQSSKPAA